MKIHIMSLLVILITFAWMIGILLYRTYIFKFLCNHDRRCTAPAHEHAVEDTDDRRIKDLRTTKSIARLKQ